MTTKRFFHTKEQYLAFRQEWRKFATNNGLSASQYMLYNIIRGLDPQHGFTPFQRLSKIEGMGIINRGAYMAMDDLKMYLYMSNMYEQLGENSKAMVDAFFKPFNGTFTREDFTSMDNRDMLSGVPEINIGFGKGRKVFASILAGNTPKTGEELMAIYDAKEAEAA